MLELWSVVGISLEGQVQPQAICMGCDRQIGTRKCLSQSISIVPFPRTPSIFHIFVSQDTQYLGRDSSVSIATRYGLDGLGIESWLRVRFSTPVQTGPGAHPASYTMGIGSFPGVMQPGRGDDHPPYLALRLKEE
jgi:hypothetical protein